MRSVPSRQLVKGTHQSSLKMGNNSMLRTPANHSRHKGEELNELQSIDSGGHNLATLKSLHKDFERSSPGAGHFPLGRTYKGSDIG
jgi:hypothetical protein